MKKFFAGICLLVLVFATIFAFAQDKVVVVPLLDDSSDGGLPSGAVMYFNDDTCPAGWSPLVEGQGRVVIGVAPAVGAGTAVGTPISDGNLRTITDVPAHQHYVNPPYQSVTVDSENEHSHTVDPAAFTTGANDGAHTHDSYMSLAGDHGHSFRIENMVSFGDYAVAGSANNAGGMTFTTPSAGSHRHDLTIYESYHTHQIDVPQATTNGTTSHTHPASFNMAAFQSDSTGISEVDVTMPYIQLLICEKD